MESFITIVDNSKSEIVEKKSRFIANIFYVENVENAEEIIKQIKRKYHDAKHNCMAYRIATNENVVEKSSDDGEPSGTAGAPILTMLKKNDLCNVLVVVTRYFGGILLGTGGLVRAYTDATLKAIENSKKVCRVKGLEFKCEIDYKNFDNFKYYCNNSKINIINIQYSNIILCNIQLEETQKEKLLEDIGKNEINIRKIEILSKKYINKCVEK